MTKHVPPPRSQAIAMLIRRRVRGFLRAALLRPLRLHPVWLRGFDLTLLIIRSLPSETSHSPHVDPSVELTVSGLTFPYTTKSLGL